LSEKAALISIRKECRKEARAKILKRKENLMERKRDNSVGYNTP
jgi:hypothetical protein